MARSHIHESRRSARGRSGALMLQALVLCAGAAVIYAGPVAWAQEHASAGSAPSGAAMDLYLEACSTCHGEDMSGHHGPALTGPEFSGRWTDRPIEDMERVIRTSMPVGDPGSLSAEQSRQLAELFYSQFNK